MFEVVSGIYSVPGDPFLVEKAGDFFVDWGRERAEPDSGKVLHQFATLATLEEPEVGPAVVQFIRRFGSLVLCEEHKRYLLFPEHMRCKHLKPEPVSLWMELSGIVAKVLRVNASVSTAYGDFDGCMKAKEWTPLSPGEIEHKFYAPGTGLVYIEELKEKTVRVELVDVLFFP